MPTGGVLRLSILHAPPHARSGASALPASLSEAVEQPRVIHFPHPRDPLLIEPCRRTHGSEVVHDVLSLGDAVTLGQGCHQPTIAYALVGILLHRLSACVDRSGVITEQITSDGDDVEHTPVLGIAGTKMRQIAISILPEHLLDFLSVVRLR